MLAEVGVKGNDVDAMERMSRVFNTSGDLRLTFHEMLDGLAILLGGSAEQKFELFFLMYQHVDSRRVGSGALLDRQNAQTGQSHAAASQFCVYTMMTEINRQVIDPILEHTGLEGKFWRKKAAEEISSFVEDMRYSGHEMLTFAQLWKGLSTPKRQRAWLVELIGTHSTEQVFYRATHLPLNHSITRVGGWARNGSDPADRDRCGHGPMETNVRHES